MPPPPNPLSQGEGSLFAASRLILTPMGPHPAIHPQRSGRARRLPLQTHRHAHAAADAQRRQALLRVALLHLVQQRRSARARRRRRSGGRWRSRRRSRSPWRCPSPGPCSPPAPARRTPRWPRPGRGRPAFQPARASALRVDGIGPVPITAGSTPAVAKAAMRASGVSPRFAASAAVISTSAAAPSLMPEALPAVTVPSLVNAGRSLAIVSSAGVVADVLVVAHHRVALAALDRHRHDLVLEPPGLLRRARLLLRWPARTHPAARG